MTVVALLAAAGEAVITPQPWAQLGLVGSLGAMLAWGLWHGVRLIFRNRNARKALGVGLGLEDDLKAAPPGTDALTKALIEFVHRQEAAQVVDRQDRARQWERIEENVLAIRTQAENTRALTDSLQAIASHFQRLRDEDVKTMDRIEQNQIDLGRWIYQNLGAMRAPPVYPYAYPPGQERTQGGPNG